MKINKYNNFRNISGSVLKELRLKANLSHIQIWLGHSNFQTTLRYAHADIENKRISASVISDKLALDIKKEQITELAI